MYGAFVHGVTIPILPGAVKTAWRHDGKMFTFRYIIKKGIFAGLTEGIHCGLMGWGALIKIPRICHVQKLGED